MSWRGKIYGVAPFFAIAGVFVNEGIFERLGLSVPTTIDEMEQVADKLLAAGIQPFALGARDKWPALATYMYLTNRYGGMEAFADAQARRARFDSEPFVQAALEVSRVDRERVLRADALGRSLRRRPIAHGDRRGRDARHRLVDERAVLRP